MTICDIFFFSLFFHRSDCSELGVASFSPGYIYLYGFAVETMWYGNYRVGQNDWKGDFDGFLGPITWLLLGDCANLLEF